MVATVVNLTSASSTVHYFRREGHGLGPPANDPGSGSGAGNEAGEDYYARRDDEHRKASRWRGSGAAALGLRGHVEPGEFRRVLQGYVPGTDIRLGRLRDGEHEHRPGLDITLSAPKSVSLEALLGGRGAARAMRAHDAAVRATLDFIEARLLRTRRWSREERRSAQVNAPALVAATFRHVTSRNNDPQLHTHCVVANMTRDGGQWRSAEIGLLRRSEKLVGAFYRNELAHRLRREGFALRPSMIGRVPGFEISGWPRAALEAFSSRRRQILDFIREKGWRYDARTAQAATLATRARKNEPRRAELEALWQAFAEERGVCKQPRRRVGLRNPEPPTAVEIAWRVLEQLEERASVFPARDALALALAHSPGLYRLEEIEGAFAALEREGELLPAIRRGVGQAWTTARAAHAEREVLERMNAGIGAARPLAADPVPEDALAGLTDGQREAARLILESRDRAVGVQGHAGTGKTTMLRRAVSCLGERRVLGLAPSSSAARTLSRETGLACRTLQWFLAQCREVSDGVADAGTLGRLRERYRGAVVVVDEMSLVGTAQARALLRIAERLEVARLVLVGDRRQLRGIEAGQPFRQMQQAGMAVAEMDELRRQRNPDLKAAVQDMIEGEPGEALERLGSNLQELPAEEIAGMAAALWLRLSSEARAGTALLVPTRALRAEVEEAVREGLEAEGALGGGAMEIETLVPLGLTRAETGDVRNWREGDIALFNREMKHYRVQRDDACTVMEVEEDRVRLAHGDGRPRHLKPGSDLRYRLDLFEARTLTIREGEQLRWTRNDRERGLANGDRLEVLEIRDKALRMRLADGREMRFARNDPQLRHLAYAYASTVHAAQGQTHDRVIAMLDSGAGPLVNQQTLYVQLSRAREQAVVLTDNREQLVETLEANTGERLTALEAIGETVADRAVADRAPAARIPAKSAIRPEIAAVFLEARRAERKSEAARIASEAQARRIVSWTGAAERALAARPSPEDGPAHEEWRLGLEALAAEGRRAVRGAVDAGAADDAAARRAEGLRERLESVLGEEAAQAAAARAEPWLAAWRAAADPVDPFRAASPDARIADGRTIAADPALAADLRRAVAGIVEGHEAREAALRAAEPWLRSWERFEGSFADRAAALEAPEATGRTGSGRALLDGPGLPEPVRDRIAAIVGDRDDRLAGRERERERQRQEAEARAEERARETALEAARAQARHAARALEEAGAVRRRLASGPAAGAGIGAAADRLAALAGDRDRLLPDLSVAEARRLDEAVGEAAATLNTRIAEAHRRLAGASDNFDRARVAFNCDAFRAGWEEHIASEAFQPLDAEGHREWIDHIREMAADPRLDPGRRGGLVELLHDYDTVWPRKREQYSDVVGRWNAMVATAHKRGVSTSDIYGFEALFEELRGLKALAPLSKEERDALHAAIEKQEQHEKMTLTRSLSLRL